MEDTLFRRGYNGSIEFSEEDSIYYGRVTGIRGLACPTRERI